MNEQLPVAGFWRVATADPDRVAIVDGDGTSTTFGQLLVTSRAIARGLQALGVHRGDAVAMVIPNHRSYFEVMLAAMETGIYLTPINSHLAAPEIEHVLSDSGAKAMFAHEQLADVCQKAADAAGFPLDRRFSIGVIAGFRPYSDMWVEGDAPPDPRSPGAPMIYTSGTTGKPKGVRRALPEGDPDDAFTHPAVLLCKGFGIPVGTGSHLVCGPLYHSGPFAGANSSLHAGKTLVLMDRWAPERCLELLERHRIDSSQMVPTMFHRLLGLTDAVRARYDLSALKSVYHTGAPCPREVKQKMMDWWGPVVYETYGGTEGAATVATPRRWLERPGTVGRAIYNTTVHILDADFKPVPSGETGDIWIENSTHAPSEYFNDPEKTSRMRRGNMITLGDIGYLDADGYLFLRDRKIDMIISGGVNIYPAEVEGALLSASYVADAVVIGVPDEEWGESVKAIVELRPGIDATPELEAALIEHCRESIAKFKLPRSVDFVARLPRLPNGKVEKRRLREPYWAGRNQII